MKFTTASFLGLLLLGLTVFADDTASPALKEAETQYYRIVTLPIPEGVSLEAGATLFLKKAGGHDSASNVIGLARFARELAFEFGILKDDRAAIAVVLAEAAQAQHVSTTRPNASRSSRMR